MDRCSRRVLLTEFSRARYQEAHKISERVCGIFDKTFGAEESLKLRQTLDFIASEAFAKALLDELKLANSGT